MISGINGLKIDIGIVDELGPFLRRLDPGRLHECRPADPMELTRAELRWVNEVLQRQEAEQGATTPHHPPSQG